MDAPSAQDGVQSTPEAMLEHLKSELRGKGLPVTSCVMLVLTLAWTVMRVIARRMRKRSFLASDHAYFAGQLAFIVMFTTVVVSESRLRQVFTQLEGLTRGIQLRLRTWTP
jgi:hypothetical protein